MSNAFKKQYEVVEYLPKEEYLQRLFSICAYMFREPVDTPKKSDDNKVNKPKEWDDPKVAALEIKDKTRRSGLPAYSHSYRVAKYLYDLKIYGLGTEYVIAALFHDVLEDTIFTEKSLEQILRKVKEKYHDFPDGQDCDIGVIIDAVARLTKDIEFPKCYEVFRLETEKGDLFSIENFWEERKILQHKEKGKLIEENGNPKPKLINKDKDKNNDMEYLKSYLNPSEIQKCEDYIKRMNAYKEAMEKYIKIICQSPIAMVVKIADRIDNLKHIAPNDSAEWIEKYILETIWISSIFDELRKRNNIAKTLIDQLDKDLQNALKLATEQMKKRQQQSTGICLK